MKRLLLFCMLATVSYVSIRSEQIVYHGHHLSMSGTPVLEIPDDLDNDDRELLEITVAVEPPFYMRWLMKIGSETTARFIYLHRAIVRRYTSVKKWWAKS